MRYVSTRGTAPALPFDEAMLAGLARDGGLYVPETWPALSREELAGLAGRSFEEVALAVLRPFVGGTFGDDELAAMLTDAWAGFGHVARCPLVQLGPEDWLLELHHGPTLAFKDVAMQLVARLFDAALAREDRRVTIVGATSGDTGSAAIEAFRHSERADVFILYPHGRVSDVQRRQMTTPDAAHVHAVAVEGTFDDCQRMLKAMFADEAFRDEVGLAAVNSINWARVLPQVVYYVTAALALGAPDRRVSFAVPSGNFGDVFAGSVAKRLGVPVDRLVVATNANDILHRTLRTGRYAVRSVEATSAPSMDIQVSSNFERAVFEAVGRDAATVVELLGQLDEAGGFTLPPAALEALREDYDSARADEAAIAATIRRVHDTTGEVVDPHTAAGLHAASVVERTPGVPMVALGCAHAAKFPEAVAAACGVHPALPERMADLFDLPERFEVVPDDLAAVQRLVRTRRRAG